MSHSSLLLAFVTSTALPLELLESVWPVPPASITGSQAHCGILRCDMASHWSENQHLTHVSQWESSYQSRSQVGIDFLVVSQSESGQSRWAGGDAATLLFHSHPKHSLSLLTNSHSSQPSHQLLTYPIKVINSFIKLILIIIKLWEKEFMKLLNIFTNIIPYEIS